jgi:hypothetical protein
LWWTLQCRNNAAACPVSDAAVNVTEGPVAKSLVEFKSSAFVSVPTATACLSTLSFFFFFLCFLGLSHLGNLPNAAFSMCVDTAGTDILSF